ncbi:MAG TPA: hypothetical protein VG795_11900 [Acidimicrobiia bacterium]|nr:hypothetical protein [Acidimicrobiia bacterium]
MVSTLPTGCAWDNQEFDGIPMGINQLANISAAAITGQITAVSEPRWNSRDGSKWCPPLDGTVRPIVYRDVTVKVSDVTFTSEKLTPRPGDELVIRTFGDGTPTGPEAVTFDKDHVLHENNVDGEYEVGKEAFLFVSVWDRFPTENGTEVINQVTGSWGGNFEIDRSKDLAKSVEPGRTVPYRALIARAQKERELGRKPERDPASRKNPLGE